MKKRTGIFSLVLSGLLLAGCTKDNFDLDKLAQTTWNPNLAAPLVYSKIEIQDILKQADRNGNIVIASDKFCSLIYRGNLFSLMASDFISLPDTSYSYSASLNAAQVAVVNLNNSVTANFSQTVNFNTGSTQIDSLVFKSGSLELGINSGFPRNSVITISIPSLKKNGVAYNRVINMNYGGTTPLTANDVTALDGYSIDMTDGGFSNNQFKINFEVTLSGAGPAVSPGTQANFTIDFNNPKFARLFGYIGQQFLSPDRDTVEISIFKNTLGTGSFTLVDPRISVFISNSYGVPIQASFSQFQGYNPLASPQVVNITGAPNPLNIQSPSMSEIGQVKTTSFTLDKNTSNNTIVGALNNNKSKYVIYQLNSQANPGGPTTPNFVLDTSRFKVDMEVDLPLYGTAKDFMFQDTTDFSFSNADNIESGLLRTYINNGFPIETVVQVYFTDSAYNKIDSLFAYNQVILPGAPVDANGRVTNSVEKVTDAQFSKEQMLRLKNAKKMLFKANATTTNGGNTNVKIYADYSMDLKLGLQAKFNIKF